MQSKLSAYLIVKKMRKKEVKPLIVEEKFHFEVHPEDSSKVMVWEEAVEYCESLGDGWRLPTIEECFLMYNNKLRSNKGCWSITEDSYGSAWYFIFSNGDAFSDDKNYKFYVRPVRNIN